MAKQEQIEKTWTKAISKHLLGRKIIGIAYLSSEDCAEMGWYQRPIIITLDNGIELMPMCDDEGNDGGSIATNIKTLQTIPVI